MFANEENIKTVNTNNQKQILWINCGKFIAILAVVVEHAVQQLVYPKIVTLGTFFCVTVFIFLSGATSYLSSEKRYGKQLNIWKEIWRRSWVILGPYMVATAVSQIISQSYFDLNTYLQNLINFSASPPFYFILFYLQLIAISPIIHRIIKKCSYSKIPWLWYTIIFVFIVWFAWILDRYTNTISTIIGGSKYILGSSYLIIFFLGMLFMSQKPQLGTKTLIAIAILSLAAWFGWLRFMDVNQFAIDAIYLSSYPINPPGISLLIFSIITVSFLYSFFTLLERFKFTKKIAKVCGWLGRYSLDIYLYHWVILAYLIPLMPIVNVHMRRVVYLFLMFGIPIAGRLLFVKIKNWLFNDECIANTDL